MEQNIDRFEGDGAVTAVVLSDGTKLPCDVCIIGIGVTSNTEYLNSDQLKMADNGALDVNEVKI